MVVGDISIEYSENGVGFTATSLKVISITVAPVK